MTPETVSLAALNVPLLEAIKAAPPTGTVELANRAGLVHNNLSRKLGSLLAAGLIDKTGEETWDVALTEVGEAALALLTGSATDLIYIPENRLVRWADNPRSEPGQDAAADEDFTLSIADRGVETPITVRARGEDFEVIHGDRRRRGAQRAVARGLAAPGFLVPCRLREFSDDEAYISAGVENLQREDMHWMDEARWLLGLASRGRSAAEIERLVGGSKRKKRSIQDYIKCARELSPENVAKAYLPEKLDVGKSTERPNPDCLTYTKAREMTGDKTERPALDLKAKPACVFLEVIARGLAQAAGQDRDGQFPLMPALGSTVVTRFAKAYAGGPLSTLSNDAKLIVFGFEGREILARTKITEDVHRWLTQLAFDSDPHGALWRVRTAVVGDMETHRLERDGLCVTEELNFPKAAEAAPPLATVAELEVEFGDCAADADAEADDAEEPMPDYLRRMAGPGAIEPPSAAQPAGPTPQRMAEASPTDAAEISPPPAPLAPPPLPAMLEIIVVELAHKMGAHAMKSPAGGLGAPVLADYYKDSTRVQGLVQGRQLLAIHPCGEKTLAIQTDTARAFLTEEYGLEDIDGKVTLDDAVLEQAQMRLMGAKPVPGPYSTPWLNPPPKAETPEPEAEPETPDPLSPSQRRVLREIAARALHIHKLLDGWVSVQAAATEDPDFQALWDLAFITRQPAGETDIYVGLTLAGRDHLKARSQAPQDGLSANSCATPWLRETLPPPTAAETPERPPLAALAAATRQAVALLTQLKGRSKAPKADEVDPVIRLAEAALEACAPYLGKEDHV